MMQIAGACEDATAYMMVPRQSILLHWWAGKQDRLRMIIDEGYKPMRRNQFT